MEKTVLQRWRVQSREGILDPVSSGDGGRREYRFGTGRGSGCMEVFSVFPGIELVYKDFSMKESEADLRVDGEILETNYCHEGREEGWWVCGDYLYLGPGDMSVTRMEDGEPPLVFPSGHYRGIAVILDLGILKDAPLPVFSSRSLELDRLADKFCPGRHFFAMRANSHISHIFSELYDIPGEVRDDYFKIKILELLMYLRLVDPAAERRIDRITKGQIDVIKAVRERLCKDLSQNLTIEQLAKEFCISPTALKTNFKLVYDLSVKEYLRRQRMEQGAYLLRIGNMPAGDIARQVGYTNQSKFASAFKAQFGLSPMEYRRKCAHEAQHGSRS